MPQDKTAPVAWTTFPSWEAVGAWYQGVIAGRDAITPALQAKADELTAGTKTKGEMVRVLYEYVSQHNHYVGVDFGVGRYQPHTAAEVLVNQYGDCKDKHTLLAALLRAKGFQPSAALIGVGIEMNEKVPMPGAFNHLITFVSVDGDPVWLDTTTEVAPYRVLLPAVRDKQALIVPDKGDPVEPHLAKTPADLPFPAVDHYEGTFQLMKDGTTKGDVAISLRGDDEVLMRYASRMVARAQWDLIGQTYVQTTGFNGKANGVNLGAGTDLSAPWSMRYGYTQEPWSQWKNFQIGSLLPNVAIPSIDKDKPPKEEIDFGGRHTQSAKSTVRLPEGYGVELPDPIHLKTTFATFDETYQVKDGSLISEFRLEVLQPKVAAKEWKGVKEFADKIGTQPWIQVISGEHSVLDKNLPRIGENNQTAFQLVHEVHEAIVAKDYELAQKKSDQALAINDKQAYLWSQRGFLAARTGNLKEAAEDYEREISQHPEAVDQYSALIQLEGQLGKSAEKHKYLLEYAKAAPADARAVLFVGHQLLAENDVEGALSEYRAGSKALPDNALIQVEFANAFLKAGKDDEAQPILEKVLGSSTDANVLNSGAYALADHHLMLPLAEASAQKAVDVLEAESAETGIGSVNATSFQQANLLLACWDTLGWIYFAEGKSELAEEYVMASWRSAAHPEEGLHAGEIREKKGDLKGALRMYEMALSRIGVNNAGSVSTELHTRIERLKKTGLGDPEANPGRALQEQRTFHVTRPTGVKGSGVFAVQASALKTENVAMLSGDDAVRGLSEALGRLDLGLAVPKESHALLLRSGVLFCSTESTCEFVLTPPESANLK